MHGDLIKSQNKVEDSSDEDLLGDLIVKVAGGDDEAQESLYDQSIGKVYGLAFAITQSREDAEEVACDVYTQVWSKAQSYSSQRGRGMTWLMMICRSRALDLLRRRQTHVVNNDPDASQVETADTNLLSPEQAFSQLQQSAAITQALDDLTAAQRDAIMLAFFRGSSHGDIAILLDLPLGTVKSHLRRALQSLQNVLEFAR